ncbi:spermidine/putrescine ABC transporter substrate-binding protein [Deinococcus sp. KSM4-11]|uniref:polyamine ABC transporter substrate-binding protein n=1 Tax=Deinococcus sp. KSM4-11 TaxID=2568654 RepID=UPI0010A41AB0|nr:spermidine/putrescine ABC transporter substrate-binding protein [Deinococcus sp. KSM4-11]THF88277.1 spermidine/putrescine ABC transporter substrate-binding protein [Deinococcus sp. KSM4-11]
MKRSLVLGLILLCGCYRVAKVPTTPTVSAPTPVSRGDGRTLRVFIWSEYIDPDIVTAFEKANGVKVILDTYESNEAMLAKLQGGGSEYDIAVPSNYVIQTMARAGLLQPLNKTWLPNLKNIGAGFLNAAYDPGNTYSVPYQYAATGLAFNRARYAPPTATWDLIFGPQDTLKFILLDDPREVVGAALKYLGFSANTTDVAQLRAARDLLRRTVAKRGFEGFDGGPGTRNKLLAKQIDLGQIYVGDLLIATEEDKNVQVELPQEGTTISMDTLVVLRRSPNPELAHRFINYILSAEVGAAISNYTYYATPNAAAQPLLDDFLKEVPALNPPAAWLTNGKLDFIGELPAGRPQRLYDRIWTELKSR